jgi:hypothetical protein
MMCTPQVFEPLDDMPEPTRQLLAITDMDRLRRTIEEIRRMKQEGYTIHITEKGLEEILRQTEQADSNATMHKKALEMDPSEPFCNIGTDNLWIDNGYVKLCPYHPPIGNFVTKDSITLKQMWESEITRQVREKTRACRRLCTISCLRRTPLSHKVSTFLKIA